MVTTEAKNVNEYIAAFPNEIQKLLKEMRSTIKSIAPTAEEVISYAMPTYRLHGNLVHFAAMKNHIGFYPAPSGISAFTKELSKYENSKGAVRFPLNEPLPLKLVEKIVKFRVKENTEKATLKGKKK